MHVVLSVIWFIDIAANCFGFIMHILGILAILKCKRKTNSLFILLNLSLIEAFATVYCVANDIYRVAKYRNEEFNSSEMRLAVLRNTLPPTYHEISFSVYYTTALELISILLILTLDRLMCIQYPFKYKVYFTRYKLKIILISTWFVSSVMGVTYGVFPSTNDTLVLICTCIAFAYFIVAVLTYSLILYKIQHPFRTMPRDNSENEIVQKVRFKKQYLIPALIIATYFVFYVLPSLIQRFWIRAGELTFSKFVLHECLAILLDFGFIFDALTYIFLTKYLRQVIFRQICQCLGHKNIEESSIYSQEIQEKQKDPEIAKDCGPIDETNL